MSIGDALSYGNTHGNRNFKPHPHSYIDSDGNANPNFNPDRHSYIDSDTNGNPYTDANANADGYTYTDDSLSTITDDRSYQGSRHAVQFHGTE